MWKNISILSLVTGADGNFGPWGVTLTFAVPRLCWCIAKTLTRMPETLQFETYSLMITNENFFVGHNFYQKHSLFLKYIKNFMLLKAISDIFYKFRLQHHHERFQVSEKLQCRVYWKTKFHSFYKFCVHRSNNPIFCVLNSSKFHFVRETAARVSFLKQVQKSIKMSLNNTDKTNPFRIIGRLL